MTLPSFNQFKKEVRSEYFDDYHKRELIIRLYWKDKKWYDPGYMLSAKVDNVIDRSIISFYNYLKGKNER